MPTSPRAQRTDFSLDVLGRYMCNGLDEAIASVGATAFGDADLPRSSGRRRAGTLAGQGQSGARNYTRPHRSKRGAQVAESCDARQRSIGHDTIRTMT